MGHFHNLASLVIGRAVDYMGESFTFRSATHSGVINELTSTQDAENGGFRPQYAMSIYVKKTGFPMPVIGEKLTARGRLLRIVSIAADTISYRMILEDVTR